MRNSSPSIPPVVAGAPEAAASLAVVMLHGRHETPGHMVDIAHRIADPDAAYFALRAATGAWYPERFIARIEANQPALDLALGRIDGQVRELEARGWSRDRILLMGFSQGACLAAHYVWARPARWAGLIAFTGGLIGPPGTEWAPQPGLAGTPVLLSNGDADPWVPWARVEETAAVLRASGADVDLRLYPGRDHLVLDDEIDAARTLMRRSRAAGAVSVSA